MYPADPLSKLTQHHLHWWDSWKWTMGKDTEQALRQELLEKELGMLRDEQAVLKEIFERWVVRTNCCVVWSYEPLLKWGSPLASHRALAQVLTRTGPYLASCALGDPSPLQSTRYRLKGCSLQAAVQSLLRLGSAARCQTPSAAVLDRSYFEHFQARYFFSWEKAYSILQIPWVSFLDQAMHTEACLSLPVLPVKQTGHLNVPPIPSKLCSIRWHRSFAGESNIWLHSLHSWLMPSSARFKWYNLLVTQHISVWDAAVSEKRRCQRAQRQGPAAIAMAPLREPAEPLAQSAQVNSPKSHLGAPSHLVI